MTRSSDRHDDEEFELYEVSADPYTGTGTDQPDDQQPRQRRPLVVGGVVIVGLVAVGGLWYTNKADSPAGSPAATTPTQVQQQPVAPEPTPDSTSTEPAPTPRRATTSSTATPSSSDQSAAIVQAARRAVGAYGDTGGKTDEQWRGALLPHLTEAEQKQFELAPPPREPWTVKSAGLLASVEHGAVVIVQTSGDRFRVLVLSEAGEWKADTISPTSQPVPAGGEG